MSWHWILEMEKILWVFISVTIFEIQWQILKCFHKVISSNLKTSYFWRVEIELDLIELCFCKSHFQTNVFLILKGILYLWNWYNCKQFIICALDSWHSRSSVGPQPRNHSKLFMKYFPSDLNALNDLFCRVSLKAEKTRIKIEKNKSIASSRL